MKYRQNIFTSLVKTAFCAVLAIGAMAHADDKKADPTGTWTWSQPGRNGGPDRTNTLTLKYTDSKLTGKLAAPGRGGAAPAETEIADGKVDGDTVSFNVVREFNGNSMTNKYSGKVSADKITGKTEGPGRGGAAPQSRDWEATKSK